MSRRDCSQEEMSNLDDYRCFINPESVSPHLFCSICQEVFVEPYRAPCGHSFCKNCIKEWLKNGNTCPEDRKKLTFRNMHHDFILENIIGDQKVGCPFREQGCSKILNLSDLGSHLKDCSFNPSNIPEFLKKDLHSLLPKDAECDDESKVEKYIPLKMRLFQAGGAKREHLVKAFSKQHSPKSKIRKLMQLIDDD